MSKGRLVIAPKTKLELEKHLENWLENSPEQTLAQEDFLWIGRQTSATGENGTIFSDLFGVDSKGNLVIAELKKGRTPRDIIAQILDYAAWADDLSDAQIRGIAEAYFKTREGFQEKTFDEAFREAFDIPETDELPRLNGGDLRLFIVAEEIPSRVARVCRFLRSSHGINVSCVDISIFQTESHEIVVSTETVVGDEDFVVPKTQQQERPSSPPRPPSDRPIEDIILETVQEFTKGDLNAIFTLKEIEQIISEKHPDLAKSDKVRNRIRGSCVDFEKRHTYSPIGPNTYQWVSRGKYRLYNSEKDKVETDNE
ncbi:hypothetical protein C6503_04350 [Candidatus Poribacteria bacterium]|nr:MAG: hypothetical protein C6503_04350 [Candidatus Poribacteria bacterium]